MLNLHYRNLKTEDMQNKKRLHKHLLMIYIIYFAALIVGFAASFVPDFSRGWRNAQNTLEMEIPQGGICLLYTSPSPRD